MVRILGKEYNVEKTKYLDLSGKDLDHIPLEVFELVNITHLYIYCNNLTTLPPEIGRLKKLESISAFSNKIKYLPKEIGDLENLQCLYFDDNNGDILFPLEIGKLKKITDFHVNSGFGLDIKIKVDYGGYVEEVNFGKLQNNMNITKSCR